MSILNAIDAIPAHMPASADEAVLFAKITAFHAAGDARRCAQHSDSSYHHHLAQLDALVNIGMLDKAYADEIAAEVKASFDKAVSEMFCTTKAAA